MHSNTRLGHFVTPRELALLLASVAILLLLLLVPTKRGPFVSSEMRFTDASAHGLSIVPASCPSSPHYSGDCSVVTDPGGGGGGGGGGGTPATIIIGSGTGVCTPSNICLSGNVINSCTGVVQQACTYGCSGGVCLPPPSPAYVGFEATGPNGAFTATGHLQVRPTLLLAGQPAYVFWNVSNVTSCTIAGSNGDSWSGGTSGSTGVASSAVFGQTTFTLDCTGIPGASVSSIHESVTVNVAPTFQEQ